jgi:hypothetical protein
MVLTTGKWQYEGGQHKNFILKRVLLKVKLSGALLHNRRIILDEYF